MSTKVTIYQGVAPEQVALAMRVEERIQARMISILADNEEDLREAEKALSHGGGGRGSPSA